jgi:hypothetical protein
MKYLMRLMESLPMKLEVIADGEGNHTEHQPEEMYKQWPLFRVKNTSIDRKFNLNMHAVSFYLAHTVYLLVACVLSWKF